MTIEELKHNIREIILDEYLPSHQQLIELIEKEIDTYAKENS